MQLFDLNEDCFFNILSIIDEMAKYGIFTNNDKHFVSLSLTCKLFYNIVASYKKLHFNKRRKIKSAIIIQLLWRKPRGYTFIDNDESLRPMRHLYCLLDNEIFINLPYDYASEIIDDVSQNVNTRTILATSKIISVFPEKWWILSH